MEKLDKFDYEEPPCPLSGGKEFYYPDTASPVKIPVERVIEKLDRCYSKNDTAAAKRLLDYWQREALSAGDLSGELSVINELLGYYRKTGDKPNSEKTIIRAFELIDLMKLESSLSGATVMLNIATNKKAFGDSGEAVELYAVVLKIYNKELRPDDARFAGLYNNYALSLADLGKTADAEKYFTAAVDLCEENKNEKINAAITYINTAEMYYALNPLDERVEDLLQKASDILENEKNQNGYYAFVISKCAPSFRQFGWFFVADELTERARKIYERS